MATDIIYRLDMA
jgi:hypothetical protein